MSRFSKAEAEARGWSFVHETPETTEITSSTQGETRYTPPSIRAEKFVSSPGRGQHTLNQEGETMGLLLERIASQEAALESAGLGHYEFQPAATPADAETAPRDALSETDPEPLGTVILPGGVTVSDAEWIARSKGDAIYDGEKMVFKGTPDHVEEAVAAREEVASAVEYARTETFDPGETEQVEYDTAHRVDSPGQGAGGQLVVRKGEDLSDLQARREADSQEHETRRVGMLNDVPLERVPSPVGKDYLAGVDAGIQHRGDLDSERPRVGETAEAAATPVEDVEIPEESVADVRHDAIEEKAKEIREDKGRVEADKPENATAAYEAGAEAEQDAADVEVSEDEHNDDEVEQKESTETVEADEKPKATPAAQKLANQNGVNLDQIQGTGHDGEITVPDVANYLGCQDEDDE